VNGPSALSAERERNSLMMASAGISHIVVSFHEPWKVQHILSVALRQLVFRQLEMRQPRKKLGLEDLRAAVETVTRQPDHLLLGEL
jgi:hypothetical protein